MLHIVAGHRASTSPGGTVTHPHDPYVEAVIDALTAGGLEPAEWWTSDGETKGVYCYLNAVIQLDPSGTRELDDEDIPAGTSWPHGLMLSWEWHTGLEEGGPERGPLWEFAELKQDGSSEYPTSLPVYGFASPAAIVETARAVTERRIKPGHFHNFGQPGWDGGIVGGSWGESGDLEAACLAWAAIESGGDGRD
jgi:hypothetical protein